MMRRDFDDSQVSGRLVGFVRVSLLSSELESQKETISGFASSIGNSIRRYYEDMDRKRSQYHESRVLQNLLRDAEAGAFDWVIIDKAQRVGTDEFNELAHFITECDKRGVQVWSVSEGPLSRPDILASINLLLGSASEQKDQRNKAENVSRGMFRNAKAWNYNGAILPYAYDRLCIAADGSERFRVVELGRELNPNQVEGSKLPEHRKFINRYEVIYPTGHREIRTDPPGKAKHERYTYALSIRKERIEVVRTIFRMYSEGFNRHAIARHLVATKADPSLRLYWRTTHVSLILRNPIYGGILEWKKTTSAKYASIGPDGQYLDVAKKRRDRKGRAVAVEANDRIRAEVVREDLRLIDPETFAACAKRLADEAKPAGLSRKARSDSFWLQPYLRCGHCGASMQGSAKPANPRVARRSSYRCAKTNSDYNGTEPADCAGNRVTVAELDAKVGMFLEQYGDLVALDVAITPPDLSRFDGPKASTGLLKRKLFHEMLAYVLARIDDDRADLLGVPGGLDLAEEYRRLADAEAGLQTELIESLKAELKDQMRVARKFEEGTPAHELAIEEITVLSQRIEAAKAAMVPLDQQFDAASRQAREIQETIQSIQKMIASQRGHRAGEAMRKVLSHVEIFSVPNPNGVQPARLTDRIVFHPIVGEPIEYTANWLPGTTPLASVARAREIYLGGANLLATAKQLQKEGVPTATGRPWGRPTLLKMLAKEIAARQQSGTARRNRSRRKAQDDSDVAR
jgi:DNA invertase Pin-like site-specific DNA recombinase